MRGIFNFGELIRKIQFYKALVKLNLQGCGVDIYTLYRFFRSFFNSKVKMTVVPCCKNWWNTWIVTFCFKQNVTLMSPHGNKDFCAWFAKFANQPYKSLFPRGLIITDKFFFYINLNLCEPTVIHFQPLAHSCLQICFATEQIASFNSTRSI